MKKLYALLTLVLFFSIVSVQAQWTATSGPYGGYINSIKIAPNGNLYSVVNGQLWKSTNNGDAWTQLTGIYLTDIMIDTDGKLYAVQYSQLYSSSDAGATWTTISSNLFQNGQYITRVGPDNVFVVWGYSGVYVSINKGVAWTQITTLSAGGLPGLWANSAGDIFYTTNAGALLKHPYKALTANWSSANMTQIYAVSGSNYNFVSMAFDASSNIYLAANYNMYKSVNGGTSFADVTAATGLSYFYGPMGTSPDGSVSFFGNASFIKTTNGTTWTATTSPNQTYGTSTVSSVFSSASTYFMATSDGVLRTSDTGTTWLQKSNGITNSNSNQIVVANTTGKIILGKYGKGYLSSTDGGATWNTTSLTGGNGYTNKVLKLSDGTILLYGQAYIYKSTDNGATFSTDGVYRPYDNSIIEAANGDLYLFNSNYVNPNYVPQVSKSTNKGSTWATVSITGLPTYFIITQAAIDGTTNMIVHGYDQTNTYKTFSIVGTTATQRTLPYTNSLNNLFFQNNKFYASQYSAYYTSSDLGVTWNTVSFSGPAVFPIKNATYTGIAVSGYGSLYISQDDGGTWSNTTMPSTSGYITAVAADASGNYYASAYNSPVLKYTSSLLVNPSTLPPYINFNWQALNGPYGGIITKIQSTPDGNTLFAIVGASTPGSQTRLWKYSSGKWTQIDPVGTNAGIYDVEVDGSGNVFVLPFINPQKIYKSTNLGTSWTVLTSTGLPATSSSIRRIEVLADGSILAFGTNSSLGRIYKSSDGGATFTLKFTSAYNVVYGADNAGRSRKAAVNPVNNAVAIFAAPNEGMIVSTDNGSTWTVKPTTAIADATNGFIGSYMYDKNGNLIIQSIVDSTIPLWDARISKSTDDGSTYTTLPTPTVSTPNGASNYSKRVVVLGTGEYLMCIQSRYDCYRSTDGGATWNLTGNVGDVFVWALTEGTTSYVLGSSDAGILKTTDGGLTFAPFSQGIPHPSSSDIKILNNQDLVIGATRPFHSSDFGQNFTLATLEPASNYLQVKDSLIGFGGRKLVKSKDGGKTWAEFGADLLYYTYLTKDATGLGFYGSDGVNLFYSSNLTSWTQVPLSGLPGGNGYIINNAVIDQNGVIYAIISDNNTSATDVYKIVFGSATKISQVIGTTNPANIQYVNNKIYLYDGSGIIFKSSDGLQWTQATAPSGYQLVVANIGSNNYLFIPFGNSGLWLSRNDGGSWQNVGDVPPATGLTPFFQNIVINEYDGYAYATLGNSVAKKSGNMVIPNDNTAPVITAYGPTLNATNAGLTPTISMTFDEVTKSVAGKLVRIFDVTNISLPVESIDMSLATQNYKTWNIPTTTPLSFNKTYFVIVDAGAVKDIFGNDFAGISSSSTWRFTTKGSPTITTLSPVNAASNVAVNSTFTITFSEPVSGLTGKNLNLYKASAPTTVVASLSATTAVSSGNQLTYTFPNNTITYNTSYFLKFDATAFATADGGTFSALTLTTDWNFQTVNYPDKKAPVITYTPPDNLTKGAGNKTFSVTITDSVSVATAKIFFRSITKTTGMDSANLTLNGSKWEASVPEATFGPMGLEYYFTAIDPSNNKAISPATGHYYSYIVYGNSGSSMPQIPTSLIGTGGGAGDWRMISVPFKLADANISTVFNELGSNDNTKWRMVTYKNSSPAGWNEYPSNFSSLTQGLGYFINVKNLPGSGIAIDNATTPANNQATPFKFTLTAGWNQIGNPYNFPMKWSEVLAANSNPSGVALKLKKFTGTYVDDTSDGLAVFEGAFVLNSNTSAVTLTVPVAGSQAGGRIVSTGPELHDLSGNQWVVPISLKVGNVENTFGGVGMNPDALVGVDNHDDFNPPHFENFAEMSFPHPEHFLKESTRDVVPTQSDYEWKFIVNSNQQGQGNLTWNNSEFGSNSKELFLYDLQSGVLIDMHEQNSYAFDPKKSSAFKIYYGSDLKTKIKPVSVTLGDAYPNPAADNVTIPFTVPDQSDNTSVRLEVFDMMGRRVDTLIDKQLPSGFYSTQWQIGSDHKSGLYVYRLAAGGQTLSGKIVIMK